MSHERGKDPPARVIRNVYDGYDDNSLVERHKDQTIHNRTTSSPVNGDAQPRMLLPRELVDSATPFALMVPTDDGPSYKDQARDANVQSPLTSRSPAIVPKYKDQVRPLSSPLRALDSPLPLAVAVAIPESLPVVDMTSRTRSSVVASSSDAATMEATAVLLLVGPNPPADRPSPRFASEALVHNIRPTRHTRTPRSPSTYPPLAGWNDKDGAPTAEERQRSDERRQASAERLRLLFGLEPQDHPLHGLTRNEESSLHTTSNVGSPTRRGIHVLQDEHALRRLRLGGEWALESGTSTYGPYQSKPNDTGRAKRVDPTTSVPSKNLGSFRQKEFARERPSETPRAVSPPSSEWRGGTGTTFPQHDGFLDGDGAWCRKPNVECAASLRSNGWAAAAHNATVGRLEI
jgi:hypothetical protein